MFARTLVLASLLAGLGACQTAGQKVLVRSLPAAPAYARPVSVADPRSGEDALIVAARERMGRAQANCVITNFRDWYERVRQAYASGGEQSAFVQKAEAVCGKFKRK